MQEPATKGRVPLERSPLEHPGDQSLPSALCRQPDTSIKAKEMHYRTGSRSNKEIQTNNKYQIKYICT